MFITPRMRRKSEHWQQSLLIMMNCKSKCLLTWKYFRRGTGFTGWFDWLRRRRLGISRISRRLVNPVTFRGRGREVVLFSLEDRFHFWHGLFWKSAFISSCCCLLCCCCKENIILSFYVGLNHSPNSVIKTNLIVSDFLQNCSEKKQYLLFEEFVTLLWDVSKYCLF